MELNVNSENSNKIILISMTEFFVIEIIKLIIKIFFCEVNFVFQCRKIRKMWF